MIVRLPSTCRPAPSARRYAVRRPRIEWFATERIEAGRNRLMVAVFLFAIAFAGLAARLVDLAVLTDASAPRLAHGT